MKSTRITLALSLLMITACSPQAIPSRTDSVQPVRQTTAITPAPKPRSLTVQSPLEASASLGTDSASFRIGLNAGFKTQALDQSTISHFKLEVRDGDGKVWRPAHTDANGLLPISAGSNVVVAKLPLHKRLYVSLTPYTDDAPATPLSCATIQAVFELGAAATIAINYRSTPTAAALWSLAQTARARAADIDPAELQAYLDALTGYSGPGSYTHHPLLIDTAALAGDLEHLDVAGLTPGNPAYLQAGARLTIHVAGLATDDQARLVLRDPSSEITAPIVNGDVVIDQIKIDGCATWNLQLNSDYTLNMSNPTPLTFADADEEYTLNVVYGSTAAPAIGGFLVNDIAGGEAYREIDEVTLTGSNFLSATTLTLREVGGADRTLTRGAYDTASFEVVNDATIRFRVPDTVVDNTSNDSKDLNFILRNGFAGGSDSSPSASFNVVQNVLVDDTAVGANTGNSWTDAYTDLKAGLSEAEEGDEVWIAAGTYKPSTTATRSDTFALESFVRVYGGFEGTETANTAEQALDGSENNSRVGKHARTPSLTDFVSILSGDIDGATDVYDSDPSDGSLSHSNMAGNSYHVVTGANNALLDGVTIQGGNANAVSHLAGGGILNNSVSPTLSNLTLRYNMAGTGGGMLNAGNSPSLSNVIFAYNSTSLGGAGGGVYNAGSTATFSGGEFTGNIAHVQGGGMYNVSSSLTMDGLDFTANRADEGAGLYGTVNSHFSLSDSLFSANVAASAGGGIYSSSGNPTLTEVDFESNIAGTRGGGMMNASGNPALVQVKFEANRASGTGSGDGGGGMHNAEGNGSLTDVDFIDNLALKDGGGLYNREASPSLLRVDFEGNEADSDDNGIGDGGGMFNFDSDPMAGAATAPALTETRFENNTAENGGGLYNADSRPTLSSADFSANEAHRNGGGIFNLRSDLSLNYGNLVENLADRHGGGMHNRDSSPTLSNVIFVNNNADNDGDANGDGGGMYNLDSDPLTEILAKPRLTQVAFITNQAQNGGGMYSEGAWPNLNNLAFYANQALVSGAASYHLGGELDLVNGVFVGNAADADSNLSGAGGALYLDAGTATPTREYRLSYASFSKNTAPSASGGGIYVNNDPNLALELYNTLYWKSPHDSTLGTNFNIYDAQGNKDVGSGDSADPFVSSCEPLGSDHSFFTDDDGLRLSNNQPTLINFGYFYPITGAESDLAGVSRDDTTPEPGAYEDGHAPLNNCP